jgi:hypothetical protein
MCAREITGAFVNIEFLSDDEDDVTVRSVCIECACKVVSEDEDES